MPLRFWQEVQEMLREGAVTAPRLAALWYAGGLRFACTRCGSCCGGAPGYVWVQTTDVNRIAGHLNLTPDEFVRKHVRNIGRGRSLRELHNGDCEFLERLSDGRTRCRIHEVRPVQCRTWPFWKSNLASETAWKLAAGICPGMNTGELYSMAQIEAYLKANGRRPL